MNRREFLEKALVAGSAVAAGFIIFTKAVLSKRFVWARPVSKYPGRLKPLGDINTQSKWSG